jgi:hypothetical protein
LFGFSSFSQAAYADDGIVNVAVSVTGVAGTGQVGTAEAKIVAFVSLTGVEATGGVGQIEAPNTGVILTGSAATGQVNNPIIIGNANFTPIEPLGFGTGEVGTVSITAFATVPVTGVSATGEIGTAAATAGANVPASGITATGAVGSVTVVEGQGIDVPVTGVAATGAVGSVTVIGDAVVLTTGLSATGSVKPVLVWGRLVPAPGTIWTQIAA